MNRNIISSRLVWLDWMKTLAMYLIIAGHCYVPGYKYIYVFSVPVFFIMSGFLSKRESDDEVFWGKLFWNLIVPMVLLIAIHMCYESIYKLITGSFEVDYLWKRPIKAALGFQKDGLGVMWFVYTLVICKITLQLIPRQYEKPLLLVGCFISLSLCYLYNKSTIRIANAIVDTFLAFPFYAIGYILRPYKEVLSSVKKCWMPFPILVGAACIWFCGSRNEFVYLYCCSYGDSLLLCFIGALGGTAMLYGICRLLDQYLANLVRVTGGGTIVILGLHGILISIIIKLITFDSIWRYVESLLILIATIPIISFCKKHIPILYGNRRA